MTFEADWSFCFVEFRVRKRDESKGVPVLIGRLLGVLFNDSRIFVSYKFADSSESAIGEENWSIRINALAGAECAGYGRCAACCGWGGGGGNAFPSSPG